MAEKINGPIFLKEDSEAKVTLEKLKHLHAKAKGDLKDQIEQDIKMNAFGIIGEEKIAFELKNSHQDIIILHDLRLEYGDLTSQIDYLVISRKGIYVIECKNLIGDIEITNDGSFVRKFNYKGRWSKKGIYSPVTQNTRHLEIMKKTMAETKSIFTRGIFEKNFPETHRSIIVLANPETILNAKYAPKKIRNQVIRADQIIEFIKNTNSKIDMFKRSDSSMWEISDFYLNSHKPNPLDYCSKYERELGITNVEVESEVVSVDTEQPVMVAPIPKVESVTVVIPVENEDNDTLISELKAFRLQRSREEKIKPYFIFNDSQMMDIIIKKPKSNSELLKCSGFAEVKVQKYGEKIIDIVNKCC